MVVLQISPAVELKFLAGERIVLFLPSVGAAFQRKVAVATRGGRVEAGRCQLEVVADVVDPAPLQPAKATI